MGEIIFDKNLGYSVYGENIWIAWIQWIKCILENWENEADEKRNRLSLQNFRLKSLTMNSNDSIFEKYWNKKNIEIMKNLVFNDDLMIDCDITPSFTCKTKSYKVRIFEKDLLNYIVERLKLIPESKKAIMVFPDINDYNQVRNNPFNDYFPCITSIQFRLRPIKNRIQKLNTIVFMRSWNIDQKWPWDLIIYSILCELICEKLNLENQWNIKIVPWELDVFITDVHIYENTIENAKNTLINFYNNEWKK